MRGIHWMDGWMRRRCSGGKAVSMTYGAPKNSNDGQALLSGLYQSLRGNKQQRRYDRRRDMDWMNSLSDHWWIRCFVYSLKIRRILTLSLLTNGFSLLIIWLCSPIKSVIFQWVLIISHNPTMIRYWTSLSMCVNQWRVCSPSMVIRCSINSYRNWLLFEKERTMMMTMYSSPNHC